MKEKRFKKIIGIFLILLLLCSCGTPKEVFSVSENMSSAVNEPEALEENGSYVSKEDVASYLRTYGYLPDNFITKKEAKKLGWVSNKGNLWDVAPGKSIGGDHYGNYEGLLPKGSYQECDINYQGGFRGAERIIFSKEGVIYYTDDHYESFTELVESEEGN